MKKLIYLLLVLLAIPACFANNNFYADFYKCDTGGTWDCPYGGDYPMLHYAFVYGENLGWRDGFWKNMFSWPEQMYNYEYSVGSISNWNDLNTNSSIKYVEVLQSDLRFADDGVRNETINILIGNYSESNTPVNYPVIKFLTLNRHDASAIFVRIVFEDGMATNYNSKSLINFNAYMPSSTYGLVCKQQIVIQQDIQRSKLSRLDEISLNLWQYIHNIVSFNYEIWNMIFWLFKIAVILFAFSVLLYAMFFLINLIKGPRQEGGVA